jgi:diadenosine tetraphosphatase ApaH/serine/threonine PP2A family protein phosphatase
VILSPAPEVSGALIWTGSLICGLPLHPHHAACRKSGSTQSMFPHRSLNKSSRSTSEGQPDLQPCAGRRPSLRRPPLTHHLPDDLADVGSAISPWPDTTLFQHRASARMTEKGRHPRYYTTAAPHQRGHLCRWTLPFHLPRVKPPLSGGVRGVTSVKDVFPDPSPFSRPRGSWRPPERETAPFPAPVSGCSRHWPPGEVFAEGSPPARLDAMPPWF